MEVLTKKLSLHPSGHPSSRSLAQSDGFGISGHDFLDVIEHLDVTLSKDLRRTLARGGIGSIRSDDWMLRQQGACSSQQLAPC